MKAQGQGSGAFEKVDGLECLYRYTANGTYYARIKTRGKEFRRSLQTTDRAGGGREHRQRSGFTSVKAKKVAIF